LFQWHACELAELSACRAKCMTTINMIYDLRNTETIAAG